MNDLVSILIPCHNAEAWLSETLESALSQTWPHKEIILVDDGSVDQSLEIADQYKSRDVKVVSQSKQGAAAARNRALREAQGDFIQYLDADDLLAPDKIEQQLQFAGSANMEVVITGEWARFHKSPKEADFTLQPVRADMEPVDWLVHIWGNHLMMHPAAWLIPRQIIEQAGPWNESLSLNDDGEYFCRIVLASKQVRFCVTARSYYRSGLPASLSGLRTPSGWDSAFTALELNCNNLLAKEDSHRTRQACAATFQRFIYEIYPERLELRNAAAAKVNRLGGTDIKPSGGALFHLLVPVIGWKAARRLQRFLHEHGYIQLRRSIKGVEYNF